MRRASPPSLEKGCTVEHEGCDGAEDAERLETVRQVVDQRPPGITA